MNCVFMKLILKMKIRLLLAMAVLSSTTSQAKQIDRHQSMQVPQAEFQLLMEKDFARYMADMKTANFYVEPDSRSKAIFERIKQQALTYSHHFRFHSSGGF